MGFSKGRKELFRKGLGPPRYAGESEQLKKNLSIIKIVDRGDKIKKCFQKFNVKFPNNFIKSSLIFFFFLEFHNFSPISLKFSSNN